MKKTIYLLLALILFIVSFGMVGCMEPEKDKVNIKYYADASEIAPLILAGKESIGLVPEPAATALQNNAQKQGKTLHRLDLQRLYDNNEQAYPQAVLLVKKSVLGTHSGIEQALEQKISQSVDWAKQNVVQAVNAIGERGATTLKAPTLSAEVIDACKIYWQSAINAKQSVKNYINHIIEIDSAKAKTVDDDFFFTQSNLNNQEQEYLFVTPDGAPAIAISKLMNDNDNLLTQKKVDYKVVSSGEIRIYLATGTAHFILAPVNMASQLYKQSDVADHYVMVAVVTHGNFYIISTEQININDLSGKRIAVPMMGAVPDWTLQMVLKRHKLSYITVE